MRKEKHNGRIIFFVLLALFIISVAPLLLIAPYNHPSADDFNYGAPAIKVMRETGSVIKTVFAAVDKTADVYVTWQGTFIAVFLMSLQPAVFAEELYMAHPILLLIGFILSNAYLMKVIFMDRFGADKYSYGIITVAVLFLSVQFVFSPVEAFYWYNSAMYYTGFYILAQVMFAVAIRADRAVHALLLAALGFLTGGGNFVVALTSLLIMAVIFLYRFVFKKGKWLIVLPGLLSITASLLITVTAPGNAVRQSVLGELGVEGMLPTLAVIRSFEYAVKFIANPLIMRGAHVFAFICLTPFLYKIAEKSNYTFKMPLFVTAVFFCVFASTFTPNLYAMSSFGPPRVLNVNQFSFIIFVLLTLFYWCGWAAGKMKLQYETAGLPAIMIFTFIFLLFVFDCKDGVSKDVNSMSGASAFNSLITGEAQSYHMENLERLKIYEDDKIENAEVTPFTVKPNILFLDEISENEKNNTIVADFYGKDSVKLLPD